MINDALLYPITLNEFTKALKSKIESTGSPVLVKLRTGAWMEVMFDPGDGDGFRGSAAFRSPDHGWMWKLNGESFASSQFDMIEADLPYEADPIEFLKKLKSRLMHTRRFLPDTLDNCRRACTEAEGEIEEFLNSLK